MRINLINVRPLQRKETIMSFWKRLLGKEPASPNMSSPRQSRQDTSGFFVFDYNAMDSYYGKQAFDAIYAAMRSSAGTCAFHDGDIFNVETVREIARQCSLVMPSSADSPLSHTDGPLKFGPYFAAMWTDTPANFTTLHDSLVATRVPGYLGYMTLPGRLEYQEVIKLFTRQLSLPASIAMRDGSIIKGTSKYGIGFHFADGALIHAAQMGELEAARKAIADGADVDCIDPNDRIATPIVHASNHGYLDIVKLLLQNGADPNARNLGSNTALMLAARFGHVEVVRALIAGGADVNAQDRSGGTALDNADEHPDIQRVLREAGARK
jgi:hypothetical protein